VQVSQTVSGLVCVIFLAMVDDADDDVPVFCDNERLSHSDVHRLDSDDAIVAFDPHCSQKRRSNIDIEPAYARAFDFGRNYNDFLLAMHKCTDTVRDKLLGIPPLIFESTYSGFLTAEIAMNAFVHWAKVVDMYIITRMPG
jgi:hypothetical protein